MTTPWKIETIWRGQTVAVLGSGPSMTEQAVAELRKYRCIAVNHQYLRAPWADMMVALDLNLPLWFGARNFGGMKVCGVSSDKVDALYVGAMHERVVLGQLHRIEIMSSGLAAIRIAAAMGAARIILSGFDPERAPAGKYIGHAEALAALIKELGAKGIVVERHAPATADRPSPALPLRPANSGRRKRGKAA